MGGTIPWVGILGCMQRRESESSPSTHCPFFYGLGMISSFKLLLFLELRY